MSERERFEAGSGPMLSDEWIEEHWRQAYSQKAFPALTHYTAAVERAVVDQLWSGQAASGSSQGARSDVQNGGGQPEAPTAAALQQRVHPWLMTCFGPKISADRHERNHRFLEETLELVQACGCSADEAHQLVDYVYGRPVGEKDQEVGGVMITLAALCLANGLDMHEAGERELARIWTMVEKIRAKQAAKPKHSPLPIASARSGAGSEEAQPDRTEES